MALDSRQKAAARIALAGRDTAREILKVLTPEEAAFLGKASLDLENRPIEDEVLDEIEHSRSFIELLYR